jgi:para-nitrobenzyl esterase
LFERLRWGSATTPRDNAMGAVTSDYLVNFAKTGNPNGTRLPKWPRYAAPADILMDFAEDGTPRARKDPLNAAKP